jgi:N-methylhydantoinase A/oxoprolinase/acetone carboxylase beta subunit
VRGAVHVKRTVEVRYAGQGHELAVPVPGGRLSPSSLPAIQRAHAEVYAAHYGYAEPPGARLEATNWKVEVVGATEPVTVPVTTTTGGDGGARKGTRKVYFPEARGFIDCAVYDRYRLVPGTSVVGPAVIEERETTVVLLPRDRATVDAHGTLNIDVAWETTKP